MTNDPDPPTVGAGYLAPSGRIWRVRSIIARPDRVVMISGSPDGQHGAIMDITAVRRMIPLDAGNNEAARSETQPRSGHGTPAHPASAEIAPHDPSTDDRVVVGARQERWG